MAAVTSVLSHVSLPALAILTSCLACFASGTSPWPQYGANERHTFRGVFAGPGVDADAVWTAPPTCQLSTLVGDNNILYCPSAYPDQGNNLFAVYDAIGAIQWNVTNSQSAPGNLGGAIDADGNVWFQSGFNLYKVNGATGAALLTVPAASGAYTFFAGAPAVANGLLFVWSLTWTGGSFANAVVAVDVESGSIVWNVNVTVTQTGQFVPPSLTVPSVDTTSGFVYVGVNNVLYALQMKTGAVSAQFAASYGVNTPSVDDDGTVYLSSNDNFVYALSPGSLKLVWTTRAWDTVSTTPALGGNGLLYYGANEGSIYFVNRTDGVPLYRYQVSEAVTSVVLDVNNVVYASTRSDMYMLDGTTSQLRQTFSGESCLGFPVIAANGVMYDSIGLSMLADDN